MPKTPGRHFRTTAGNLQSPRGRKKKGERRSLTGQGSVPKTPGSHFRNVAFATAPNRLTTAGNLQSPLSSFPGRLSTGLEIRWKNGHPKCMTARLLRGFSKGGRRDLNPRPPDPQSANDRTQVAFPRVRIMPVVRREVYLVHLREPKRVQGLCRRPG